MVSEVPFPKKNKKKIFFSLFVLGKRQKKIFENVAQFLRICRETSCKVVVSSSWRFEKQGLTKIQQLCQKCNIPLIGITPDAGMWKKRLVKNFLFKGEKKYYFGLFLKSNFVFASWNDFERISGI